MMMKMLIKKTKVIQCAHCNANFIRPVVNIDQEKKAYRQHFCSLACMNDYNILLAESIEEELKDFKNILSLIDATPEKVKTSNAIDVLYLKTIWDNQEGKCIYSKVPLALPSEDLEKIDVLHTAVIDKINPSINYIKGNIRFISLAMSFIKKDLLHEKTLQLVRLIKDN